MPPPRRLLLHAACAAVLALAGCAGSPHAGLGAERPAAPAAVVAALAPSGSLRVGVYPGSPSSLVRNVQTGQSAGLAFDLGHTLGQRLGVPVQVVEFNRVAEVVSALKAGQVDFTVTNASPARARDVDFSPHLVQLALGLLVPPDSPIHSLADADQSATRVGVTAGSSSLLALPQRLKSARVVPVASLKEAQQMLRRHELDDFATNKGILFEMADDLPGFQVLPDQWGTEGLAMALPKGREVGLAYLREFAQELRQNGQLQAIIVRSGLRGTLP